MSAINRKLGFAMVLAIGLVGSGVAWATPITLFNVSGAFAQEDFNGTISTPVNGSFNGTIGIDTTTGTLSEVDIVLPGFPQFGRFTSIEVSRCCIVPGWFLGMSDANNDAFALNFTTTNPNSLVGFTGGTILDNDYSGMSSEHIILSGASGSITPASVAVPEPAELGMFGLGLLLIGGFTGLRGRGGHRFDKEAVS